jgi:mannose-6-phosphate isomerase-like protein (cupin superfamily)
MIIKRNVSLCGIAGFLFLFVVSFASVNVGNAADQIITHIDEILKANPLPPGEKAQTIPIAQSDTISILVLRATEGVVIKSHLHKTHDETVCGVKGTAQVFINDKWVDIKPGSVHFNPTGKVHSVKVTGKEPLVVIQIFTPAMKDPDRHFVE